jgi:ribosomal protein S18 acetylase RimI-like enzyme
VSDFERALAFLRNNERALADRVQQLAFGEAILTPSLRRVYSLNFVAVSGEPPEVDVLAAEAERVLGGAGLGHRRVVVSGGEAIARVAPGFVERGWEVTNFVVMALTGPRPAVGPVDGLAEAEPAAIAEMRRESIASYPWGRSPTVVDQLLESDRRLAERLDVRAFVVRDGDPVAHALLIRNGSALAQVEDVVTREAYRGRGYAKAVVSAAIDAAADAELVFLVADADDWPQELYRGLGFERIGRESQFLNRSRE